MKKETNTFTLPFRLQKTENMNKELLNLIKYEFPYPITVEVMRLSTVDYQEKDKKRLLKIFEISETIIQFLALISLSDLMENRLKERIVVPESFKFRFYQNFTSTTMGKWIELFRETIRIFQMSMVPMFISEMTDFLFQQNKESDAQKAFNRIAKVRNSEIHGGGTNSKTETIETCVECEGLLEQILENLVFISGYQFLFVNTITVKYHRWSEPNFDINFSQINGYNPELFDMHTKRSRHLIHTPAVMFFKEASQQYLNLDPLILFSDEGEKRIPDIFMYSSWEKQKRITFRPTFKGGNFDLCNTSLKEELIPELLLFFKNFALPTDYEKIKKPENLSE